MNPGHTQDNTQEQMSSQKFSESTQSFSEVSGMFLAMGWVWDLQGGFGTGIATLKNT